MRGHLWPYVNTLFIIRVISFENGPHIKKYMAKIPFAVQQRFFVVRSANLLHLKRSRSRFFNQSCSFQTFWAVFVHFDQFCAFCTIFRDFSAQIDESFRKTNEGAVASAPSGIAQAMSEGVVQQPFV